MEKKIQVVNSNQKTVAILSLESFSKELCAIAESLRNDLSLVPIFSKDHLQLLFKEKQFELLVSFGSSIIVPKEILKIPGLSSINIHAASPRYPGRDPHHYAVYDHVKEYGATMHFMTEKIDAGDIINYEKFSVSKDIVPIKLLNMANDAGIKLFKSLIQNFDKEGFLKKDKKYKWSSKKNTRADLIKLCTINLKMNEEEISKRFRACSFPGHNNVFLELNDKMYKVSIDE